MIRRALASLLLCFLTIPAIVEGIRAGTGADIPECCRRNGKHHCAMSDMSQDTAGGAAARSAGQVCPSYPGIGTVAGFAVSILPTATDHFVLSLSASPAPETSAPSDPPFTGSFVSKRGPPSISC